jgi:hypothetical protein
LPQIAVAQMSVSLAAPVPAASAPMRRPVYPSAMSLRKTLPAPG